MHGVSVWYLLFVEVFNIVSNFSIIMLCKRELLAVLCFAAILLSVVCVYSLWCRVLVLLSHFLYHLCLYQCIDTIEGVKSYEKLLSYFKL